MTNKKRSPKPAPDLNDLDPDLYPDFDLEPEPEPEPPGYPEGDEDVVDLPEAWSDEDLEFATDVHSSSLWPSHPMLSHDVLFRLLEMGIYAR